VIVKLTVPRGVDNIQKLKWAVREGLAGEAVAYVDGKVGVEAVFVRCMDNGQASRLGVVKIGEVWKGDAIVVKEGGFEGVEKHLDDFPAPFTVFCILLS
jgi:hypothetical protein